MLFFQALERNAPKLNSGLKKILNVQPPPNRTSVEETAQCIYEQICHEKFDKPLEQTRFLFGGFKEKADQSGTGLLVLLMSSPDQAKDVSGNSGAVLDEQHPQQEFRDFLTSIGVANFDLLPALTDANVEAYYYERDGHLTSRGADMVAYSLAQELTIKQPALLGNLTNNIPSEDLSGQLNQIFSETNP